MDKLTGTADRSYVADELYADPTTAANVSGTRAPESRGMDNEELIKRGIRATEIGMAALERLFRRDMDRIRDQLAALRRSIELGKPTESVARYGIARQIDYSAEKFPALVEQLARAVVNDYDQDALQIGVWPLLCLANGIEGDGLVNHIRMWCHSGAIELDEETERAMFDAAGLPFQRAKLEGDRCVPIVLLDDSDDIEERRAS